MKSTDANINHPNQVFQIDLNKMIQDEDRNTIAYLTQAEYDAMGQHDDTVIYIITDSDKGNMYWGDSPVAVNKNTTQYLMGYDPDTSKYIVYVNEVQNYQDDLIPLEAFSKPQDALNAIQSYSYIGGHSIIYLKILKVLDDYLQDFTGLNYTIISMISILGYQNDTRLQQLNQLSIIYGDQGRKKDISDQHRAMLHNIKNQGTNPLVGLYSDIYDIFVKNKMFSKYKEIDNIPSAILHQFSKDVLSSLRSYKNG